ncbi:nuclear transport factor 2 family protein [Arenibacter sp. GZD96]|uniref:nuclear transport factor 2 family protein n=1 Tax=Aurantibrevibacter litoralis TaxID=3106030 RepID=UPI002B003C82|nr:nuclear transport factor 2 family protein [Arenibacter sp. GZD-96]MEA1787579.1 nuclear transport factor 2 family protein [Arenibacter sp. GZD-96]
MNKKQWFSLFFLIFSFLNAQEETEKRIINETIDAWHKAASEANFETYFGLMTDDGVFVGTDASENWALEAFKAFSKPYFDNGKAWSFTPMQRHVYLGATHAFSWFDELLDTQMGICRGSGVLQKIRGEWKVAHYVLSIDIPNDNVNEVVALKKERDSLLLLSLKKGKTTNE